MDRITQFLFSGKPYAVLKCQQDADGAPRAGVAIDFNRNNKIDAGEQVVDYYSDGRITTRELLQFLMSSEKATSAMISAVYSFLTDLKDRTVVEDRLYADVAGDMTLLIEKQKYTDIVQKVAAEQKLYQQALRTNNAAAMDKAYAAILVLLGNPDQKIISRELIANAVVVQKVFSRDQQQIVGPVLVFESPKKADGKGFRLKLAEKNPEISILEYQLKTGQYTYSVSSSTRFPCADGKERYVETIYAIDAQDKVVAGFDPVLTPEFQIQGQRPGFDRGFMIFRITEGTLAFDYLRVHESVSLRSAAAGNPTYQFTTVIAVDDHELVCSGVIRDLVIALPEYGIIEPRKLSSVFYTIDPSSGHETFVPLELDAARPYLGFYRYEPLPGILSPEQYYLGLPEYSLTSNKVLAGFRMGGEVVWAAGQEKAVKSAYIYMVNGNLRQYNVELNSPTIWPVLPQGEYTFDRIDYLGRNGYAMKGRVVNSEVTINGTLVNVVSADFLYDELLGTQVFSNIVKAK